LVLVLVLVLMLVHGQIRGYSRKRCGEGAFDWPFDLEDVWVQYGVCAERA
jgi:hypothetical protein